MQLAPPYLAVPLLLERGVTRVKRRKLNFKAKFETVSSYCMTFKDRTRSKINRSTVTWSFKLKTNVFSNRGLSLNVIASSAEIMGAFKTGFEPVSLHRPTQDGGHDGGAVQGRVGIHRARQQLHLRLHAVPAKVEIESKS
jgi:hypothetical protein